MSGYEFHWSPRKCLAVALSWAIVLAAFVIPICVAAVIGNRNADQQRLDVVKACVDSGQSWVGGNCVRGTVVNP